MPKCPLIRVPSPRKERDRSVVRVSRIRLFFSLIRLLDSVPSSSTHSSPTERRSSSSQRSAIALHTQRRVYPLIYDLHYPPFPFSLIKSVYKALRLPIEFSNVLDSAQPNLRDPYMTSVSLYSLIYPRLVYPPICSSVYSSRSPKFSTPYSTDFIYPRIFTQAISETAYKDKQMLQTCVHELTHFPQSNPLAVTTPICTACVRPTRATQALIHSSCLYTQASLNPQRPVFSHVVHSLRDVLSNPHFAAPCVHQYPLFHEPAWG